MPLRERIEEDIRDAMRKRDQARVDALRYLKSTIQRVEKDQLKELTEAYGSTLMVFAFALIFGVLLEPLRQAAAGEGREDAPGGFSGLRSGRGA
jgi:hypothetical protein